MYQRGTTQWLGLWAQERQGFYAGQVIKKSGIPEHARIVLRYNKFYEKDGNRPKFVYCFADSEGYKSKCVPLELDEHGMTELDAHLWRCLEEYLDAKDEELRMMNPLKAGGGNSPEYYHGVRHGGCAVIDDITRLVKAIRQGRDVSIKQQDD